MDKKYTYIDTKQTAEQRGLSWFNYENTIVNTNNEIVAYWSQESLESNTEFQIPIMLYEFTLKWLSEIYIYAINSQLALDLFLKDYTIEELIGIRRFEEVEDIDFEYLV